MALEYLIERFIYLAQLVNIGLEPDPQFWPPVPSGGELGSS